MLGEPMIDEQNNGYTGYWDIRLKRACLTTTTTPFKRRFCERMSRVASTGVIMDKDQQITQWQGLVGELYWLLGISVLKNEGETTLQDRSSPVCTVYHHRVDLYHSA
jgi:hypothetical protein